MLISTGFVKNDFIMIFALLIFTQISKLIVFIKIYRSLEYKIFKDLQLSQILIKGRQVKTTLIQLVN